MIKFLLALAFSIIIIPLAFFLQCSNNDNLLGGGGTETGNAFTSGVTGFVQDSANRPVIGAKVYIYPVDHIPSVSAQKILSSTEYISDNNGRYYIPNVLPGTYNIDAKKDSIGVFIDSVKVAKKDTVTKAPDKKMKKFGRISGVTRMPGQNDTNQVRMTIFIPGTRRITLPNIGGKFSFDEMPEGKYKIIFNPTLQNYNVKIIDTTLKSGQSLNLDTIVMSIFEPDTIDIYSSSVYGTWGPNKVYKIFNSIDIQEGQKLRIAEGTKILFMGYVGMKIYGSIVAKGTQSNPIAFKHGFSSTQTNWSSLDASTPGISDSVYFNYCIIDRSSSVEFRNPKSNIHFEVSNCIISNSRFGLILQVSSLNKAPSNMLIYNNVFYNISEAVFLIYEMDVAITTRKLFYNNIIYNVQSIYLTGSLPISLINSDYNCIYDESTTFESMWGGQYSIVADPLFEIDSINPYSFKLSSNSPCKGTGINGTDMGIYSTYKP
ncbi:MAG: carboxypeptidase regulatory-like domain-containing protein [Fibrobacteres bacterium]|nr:carboxypeptidase regulatory-like domain-containing protein [Fibrobacterota bacterium]